MAYFYKTIGNTAAAVVSLLAVGTLCWWQRTPGPINAPRPQDEAEIMTAVLERHYAMGRTSTQFTQAKPAYVSQVPDTNAAGGVRYVTNSEAYTLTNTIGFFPNATFAYPQSIRDALAPGAGAYGTANARVWLVPSNTYWQTGERSFVWTAGMLTNYLHAETNWWTNLVTLSTQTILSTVYSNTLATNFAGWTTGWVATSTLVTNGNYCGRSTVTGYDVQWLPGTVFASNAANPRFRIYDYADPVKYMPVYKFSSWWEVLAGGAWHGESTGLALPAVMNPVSGYEGVITIDYGVFPTYVVTQAVVSTGWKVTSTLEDDVYYYIADSSSEPRPLVGWRKDAVFPRDPESECEFVIADDYLSSGNTLFLYGCEGYWQGADGSFLWQGEADEEGLPATISPVMHLLGSGTLTLDYGTWTNYMVNRMQVLVTNTSPYNAWTAGKKFAFERDSKPYTWSTNAYNDMARALSMMQWQKNEAQYAATRRQATISIYRNAAVYINNSPNTVQATGCWYPSYVYRYTTETNMCGQYLATITSITTNTTTLSPRMDVTIGELVPASLTRYTWNPFAGSWGEWTVYYSGQTNWLNFSQSITIDFVSGNVRTTNETPFVWNSGSFFMDSYVITNDNLINMAMGVFNGMTSAPSSFLPNDWTVAQGEGVGTAQICDYPLTGTGGDEEEWQAMLSAALSVSSNIWNNSGGVIPYGGYSITNHPLTHTIPYYILSAAPSNRCAYHVQFTALTNYLDHAPAR